MTREHSSGHANEAQFEAARRILRRKAPGTDRWARHDAIAEEARQDGDHYWKGGNL